MANAIIIYSSRHHGNTAKLVESIADEYEIPVINADIVTDADLTPYDLIGFASGIDFGKFYPSVQQFLEQNLPDNKTIFLMYTCAKVQNRFTECMEQAAFTKNAKLLGTFGCKGYNTYGPLKLIGGMNKGHPNEADILAAQQFFEKIIKKTDLY